MQCATQACLAAERASALSFLQVQLLGAEEGQLVDRSRRKTSCIGKHAHLQNRVDSTTCQDCTRQQSEN